MTVPKLIVVLAFLATGALVAHEPKVTQVLFLMRLDRSIAGAEFRILPEFIKARELLRRYNI